MSDDVGVKNKSILVVEDYELNQELLQLQLQEMGCRVLIANNGVEALECCENDVIDFVLMDINMPIMNGYEAARKIRGSGAKYENVPIVAMSANIDKEIKANCFSAGMNDIIVKPVGKKALCEMLKKLFSDESQDDDEENKSSVVIEDEVDDSDDKGKELYLNYEKALDEFCGNVMLLNNSIKSFLVTVDNQMILLKKAVLENDLEFVQKAMHKISGAAANLTAASLADLAAVLEKNAASQAVSSDDLSESFQIFEKFYIEFRQYIQNRT